MTVTFTASFPMLAAFGFASGTGLKLKLTNASNVELATANGYVEGGKALTGFQYVYDSGVLKVSADNVSWKATGGTIAAAKAVLVANRYSGEPALATIDFGGTQTAVANSSFVVRWHSDGLFQYSML